jgi:hypothetical protein
MLLLSQNCVLCPSTLSMAPRPCTLHTTNLLCCCSHLAISSITWPIPVVWLIVIVICRTQVLSVVTGRNHPRCKGILVCTRPSPDQQPESDKEIYIETSLEQPHATVLESAS